KIIEIHNSNCYNVINLSYHFMILCNNNTMKNFNRSSILSTNYSTTFSHRKSMTIEIQINIGSKNINGNTNLAKFQILGETIFTTLADIIRNMRNHTGLTTTSLTLLVFFMTLAIFMVVAFFMVFVTLMDFRTYFLLLRRGITVQLNR